MKIDILTIFPDFFSGPLDYGIVRRAREMGLVEISIHDLRAFTKDKHRTVDDRPFGGGEGMVLKPEPLFEAVESLMGEGIGHTCHGEGSADLDVVGARHAVPLQNERIEVGGALVAAPTTAIILLSASGKLFRQETARRYPAGAFSKVSGLQGGRA